MTKEAMKLALEAMERYQVKRQDFDRFADEITALREALDHIANGGKMIEQPAQQCTGCEGNPSPQNNPCAVCGKPAQQEPVQYKCMVIDNHHPNAIPFEQWVKPAQPAQQEPFGLVDGERNALTLMQAIDHAIKASETKGSHRLNKILVAAKKALTQPEQEPVATVIKKGAERQWMSERLGALPDGTYSLHLAPPAQQEPLTDEQWQQIADITNTVLTRQTKNKIEAVIGIKENT